jgi:hypothetical protein
MTRKLGFLVTLMFSAVLTPVALLDSAPAYAEEEKPDPKAVALLDSFMGALQANGGDMDAAIKAAKPFLHRSLLSKDGSDVSPDLRRFSFKKAWENAKFYAAPVKITRMRPTGISAIGFKETAEAGKVVDYFIAKKQGVNGMPAPVKIFFPASGGEPRISYIGSI